MKQLEVLKSTSLTAHSNGDSPPPKKKDKISLKGTIFAQNKSLWVKTKSEILWKYRKIGKDLSQKHPKRLINKILIIVVLCHFLVNFSFFLINSLQMHFVLKLPLSCFKKCP